MEELVKVFKKVIAGTEDKQKSLEVVIAYRSGLIYGDDIHKYATYSYYTGYTKKALDEIVPYIQKITLDEFQKDLETLKSELEKYKEELEKEKETLEELTKEKETLETDVKKLKEEQEVLSKENDETKESLNRYNSKIKSELSDQQVVWEPISDDHPIYGVTVCEIFSYIDKLKQSYMTKLGITKEECESDFMLNESGLEELKILLDSFSADYKYCSIYQLIHAEFGNYWTMIKSKSLKKLIGNIKLPKIVIKKELNSTISASEDTQNLIKELYFQRKLLEAVAKQQLAENQLSYLIKLIKTRIPEFDFEEITELVIEESSVEPKLVLEEKKEK